jgi:hypothetical protein
MLTAKKMKLRHKIFFALRAVSLHFFAVFGRCTLRKKKKRKKISLRYPVIYHTYESAPKKKFLASRIVLVLFDYSANANC